jgi:hypothetical protein
VSKTVAVDRHDRMKRLLTDESINITPAFFAAVSIVDYDLEVMAMDSEALLVEIQSRLNAEIPAFNRAKILFGQGAYFTDIFYTDLPSFIDFANATIAIDPPRPDVFNPANVLECSAAVLELMLINGQPEEEHLAFHPDVLAYMGAVLVSEGSNRAIKPLTNARLPDVEIIDDPAIFSSIADRSNSLESVVNREIWRHGKEIFDQLKHVRSTDGKPAISAEEMKKILTNLLGDFHPAPGEIAPAV